MFALKPNRKRQASLSRMFILKGAVRKAALIDSSVASNKYGEVPSFKRISQRDAKTPAKRIATETPRVSVRANVRQTLVQSEYGPVLILTRTLNGFSPECCLICVLRMLDAVKALLQYTHLYGRSPL